MKHGLFALLTCAVALSTGAGCRQQMAEQPYYRPYEPSGLFKDGRSARPLERGVVHRAQYLDTDPMATGLTRAEWAAFYQNATARGGAAPSVDGNGGAKKDQKAETGLNADQLQEANRKVAFGSPRYDPRDPASPKVYADEFPFPITPDDLDRGRDRYTIYCAVCHGPLGNGQGKIWERGYLLPTSFHTEMVGRYEVDQSRRQAPGSPLGHSRGYATWGISIPMRDVPVGYIYEVVARGYGGMPSYTAQIPADDRWRIVAYVRALQYSQHAAADSLPPEFRARVGAAGGNP